MRFTGEDMRLREKKGVMGPSGAGRDLPVGWCFLKRLSRRLVSRVYFDMVIQKGSLCDSGNLSPLFASVSTSINKVNLSLYLEGMLWALNEFMYAKCLERYLPHPKLL